MTWFKVDDRFHAHPKVLALRSGAHEETAIALWLKAGSWCASNLTDGAVPAYVLDSLVRKNGAKAAAELVRVGLWETTVEGFRFRSWSEYQPSKSDVESKREKTARKVADWREKKRTGDQPCNPVTRSDVPASVTLPPTRPDPTRPSPDGDTARAPSAFGWSSIGETFSRLRSEAWERKTGHAGGRWKPGTRDHGGISSAFELFRDESDPQAALEDSIRGFLADAWAFERDWPFSVWSVDPGKYRGKAILAERDAGAENARAPSIADRVADIEARLRAARDRAHAVAGTDEAKAARALVESIRAELRAAHAQAEAR